MAIKTFNPASSTDNWSTAAAWGGAIPVDGDSFIIAAGKTCYMDVSQSAMATGMIAGTINGTLSGPNGAGTGYLKMDGVATHDITIASGGSLIHGASESAQAPANSIFKIWLGDRSEINCSYNNAAIKLNATWPAHRHVRLASDASNGASAVIVDQTNAVLQADGWQVGDYIVAVKNCTSTTPTVQMFTLTSWGGGSTINLSGTLSAAYITGCYLINITSNIQILTARTSAAGSEYCFLFNNGPVAQIGCSIINTTSTVYASGYGQALRTHAPAATNYNSLVFYGAIHGYNMAYDYSKAMRGDSAVNGLRGYISNCWCGNYRSTLTRASFHTFGCFSASSFMVDSVFPKDTIWFGCVYGHNNNAGCYDSSITKGCYTYAISSSGIVLGKYADVGGSSVIDRNSNADLDIGSGCSVVGYGAMLQSPTPALSYRQEAASGCKAIAIIYDYGSSPGNPQPGRIRSWSPGGTTASEVDAGFSALGYAFCHKMTFELSVSPNFIDVPVDIVAGQPISITFDVQVSSAFAWASNPTIQLVDPQLEFEDGAGVLASALRSDGSAIDVASTVIQRLYLTYVPSVSGSFPYGAHRPATIRIKGTAGNTSGTGTDFMRVCWSQAQTVVADVQSMGGSATSLSNLLSRVDVAIGTRLSMSDALGAGAWAGTTVNDALKAAWSDGVGVWRIHPGPPPTLVIYAPDGVTPLRTFTLDDSSSPSARW
jgi:hypothetical protein